MTPFDALADAAQGEGVVGWELPLAAPVLRQAYAAGVFPWPSGENRPVPWMCPDPRAILRFERLHVPRTLRQARARCAWEFTRDRAFASVVEACAAAHRPGQRGTWITRAMRSAYVGLHALGCAQSIEVWEDGALVGGLYGVRTGRVFTGESMFHLRPNASKLAFLHLVDLLRAEGCAWVDLQQLTPHFAVLGGEEVPRAEFLALLRRDRELS